MWVETWMGYVQVRRAMVCPAACIHGMHVLQSWYWTCMCISCWDVWKLYLDVPCELGLRCLSASSPYERSLCSILGRDLVCLFASLYSECISSPLLFHSHAGVSATEQLKNGSMCFWMLLFLLQSKRKDVVWIVGMRKTAPSFPVAWVHSKKKNQQELQRGHIVVPQSWCCLWNITVLPGREAAVWNREPLLWSHLRVADSTWQLGAALGAGDAKCVCCRKEQPADCTETSIVSKLINVKCNGVRCEHCRTQAPVGWSPMSGYPFPLWWVGAVPCGEYAVSGVSLGVQRAVICTL